MLIVVDSRDLAGVGWHCSTKFAFGTEDIQKLTLFT